MSSTDNELIERIRAGHHGDFRVLVERHAADALTLAVRILDDRNEAEEAVQDAFVRAHKGLAGFRQDASFSTWFYRIVYNVCLTRRDRQKPYRHVSLDPRVPIENQVLTDRLLHSSAIRPDETLEHHELQSVVQRGIKLIPEHYRAVFTLFFTQEMSYDEIAELTELPLNTVKTRLFRARIILRDYVKAYLSGGEVSSVMPSDANPKSC